MIIIRTIYDQIGIEKNLGEKKGQCKKKKIILQWFNKYSKHYYHSTRLISPRKDNRYSRGLLEK